MSIEKHFDDEEQQFVKLVDKFYLALNLTKICSKSCGLLKPENSGFQLSAKERECITNCGNNISSTYLKFVTKVKTTFNIAEAGAGGEGGEAEE